MREFGNAKALYFGGDMEASIALAGQVAGRIRNEKPVAEIIADMIDEFEARVKAMQEDMPCDAAA
jgi:enoyl-[acyl-carrier protein] reductase II